MWDPRFPSVASADADAVFPSKIKITRRRKNDAINRTSKKIKIVSRYRANISPDSSKIDEKINDGTKNECLASEVLSHVQLGMHLNQNGGLKSHEPTRVHESVTFSSIPPEEPEGKPDNIVAEDPSIPAAESLAAESLPLAAGAEHGDGYMNDVPHEATIGLHNDSPHLASKEDRNPPRPSNSADATNSGSLWSMFSKFGKTEKKTEDTLPGSVQNYLSSNSLTKEQPFPRKHENWRYERKTKPKATPSEDMGYLSSLSSMEIQEATDVPNHGTLSKSNPNDNGGGQEKYGQIDGAESSPKESKTDTLKMTNDLRARPSTAYGSALSSSFQQERNIVEKGQIRVGADYLPLAQNQQDIANIETSLSREQKFDQNDSISKANPQSGTPTYLTALSSPNTMSNDLADGHKLEPEENSAAETLPYTETYDVTSGHDHRSASEKSRRYLSSISSSIKKSEIQLERVPKSNTVRKEGDSTPLPVKAVKFVTSSHPYTQAESKLHEEHSHEVKGRVEEKAAQSAEINNNSSTKGNEKGTSKDQDVGQDKGPQVASATDDGMKGQQDILAASDAETVSLKTKRFKAGTGFGSENKSDIPSRKERPTVRSSIKELLSLSSEQREARTRRFESHPIHATNESQLLVLVNKTESITSGSDLESISLAHLTSSGEDQITLFHTGSDAHNTTEANTSPELTAPTNAAKENCPPETLAIPTQGKNSDCSDSSVKVLNDAIEAKRPSQKPETPTDIGKVQSQSSSVVDGHNTSPMNYLQALSRPAPDPTFIPDGETTAKVSDLPTVISCHDFGEDNRSNRATKSTRGHYLDALSKQVELCPGDVTVGSTQLTPHPPTVPPPASLFEGQNSNAAAEEKMPFFACLANPKPQECPEPQGDITGRMGDTLITDSVEAEDIAATEPQGCLRKETKDRAGNKGDILIRDVVGELSSILSESDGTHDQNWLEDIVKDLKGLIPTEATITSMDPKQVAEFDVSGMTERIMKTTASEPEKASIAWEEFQKADEEFSHLKGLKPFTYDLNYLQKEQNGIQPPPQFVTDDGASGNPKCWAKLREQHGKKLDFDVVVCGGTTGIFYAMALLLKGHSVCVVEAKKLVDQQQEWNIDKDELLELKKLGVITDDDIDAAVQTELPACRSGFKNFEISPLKGGYFMNGVGYESETPGVRNLGISPSILLDRVSQRFKRFGGVIKEETALQGVVVSAKMGTAVDVGPEKDPITSSLVLDCMGSFSPISQQQRYGQKPDGICAVVGSCAAGYDKETNVMGDIFYSNSMIQDKGEYGKLQYFWESFPVGIGCKGKEPGSSDMKTTYMFTYMDADEKRPSLKSLMDDYWKMLPKYQTSIKNPEKDLDVKRLMFACFPTYRDSPLKPQWSRILAAGEAAGIQSPLSFSGLGSLTRHLERVSVAVSEALETGCLHKDDLAEINAYSPNLSASCLLQKAMSVKKDQDIDPKFMNKLLAANLEVMDKMGKKTMKPALQDALRFDEYVGGLAGSFLAYPSILPEIVKHVGLPTVIEWMGHVGMMGAYSLLDTVATPVLKVMLKKQENTRTKYQWNRRMEAWKYGSGNDSNLLKADCV